MRKNFLYLLLLALLLSCSKVSIPPPLPPPIIVAPKENPPPPIQPTIQQILIESHNALRKTPLKPDPHLMAVAQQWAEHMAKTGKMKHQSLRVIQGFSACGENIAKGQDSVKQVMTSWMNSRGHRNNILNLHYTHIGVGYAIGRNGTKFWCVDFGGNF